MDIILASHSPRRRELLARMGIEDFRVVSPGIDEDMGGDLPPAELVMTLSRQKAQAVLDREGPGSLILAADTVVSLDGAVLGKPADELEAYKMLTTLSGCRHQVYTGFTVLCAGERVTEYEATDVRFRPLEDGEIEAYIATGEPMDKAGAYAIQGYGALFVEGINGDYYNVMGLPVCHLGQVLRRFGVDCLNR